MVSIFLSVLAIGAIAAALAALLVISQKYLADYGQCKITINDDIQLDVKGGTSLLETLTQEKIFIPSACGGRGTCGYCKCKVISGGGAVLPTETAFLSDEEKKAGIRLSCQLKVKQDIIIELPSELLSVKEYETVCTKITDLTYDIKEFRFELKNPEKVKYTPGQYIQLLCPEYPNNPEQVYRAYSISSDNNQDNIIELVIRKVPGGICTTYCFEHLKQGDTVILNGPYGEFRLSETDKPMIFIAGGSGMAPMKCLLHQMSNTSNNRQCTYYFGGTTVKDHFYSDLMADFQSKLPNFKYIPVVSGKEQSDGWTGRRGLVTEAVADDYKDLSGLEAYLCGSPGMIDASIKVLTSLGMPEESIFYDKFA